jgi:SAM-dependent methyltransferase
MKPLLLEFVICPDCLPEEKALSLHADERDKDDILSGTLQCSACDTQYPIRDGIAELLPRSEQKDEPGRSRYESTALVSAYLWSHYADILGDQEATGAYKEWTALMAPLGGVALDAGCATGRFTFEMGLKSDFAVGLDYSRTFIKAARDLMKRRRATITLTREGHLKEDATLRLPESWRRHNVDFIVGDIQRLPFRSGEFTSLASLNLVDKVPSPISHLREMNRVAKRAGTQLLFSDPFSWSSEVADEKDWLGGTTQGPYAGNGIDNVAGLLEGKGEELLPPWSIAKQGHLWWKIRNHRNHFELIRSCFILARR